MESFSPKLQIHWTQSEVDWKVESYQESSESSSGSRESLQHWHAPDRLPCPAAADPEHSSAVQDLSFPCHVRSAEKLTFGKFENEYWCGFLCPSIVSCVSIQFRAGKSERLWLYRFTETQQICSVQLPCNFRTSDSSWLVIPFVSELSRSDADVAFSPSSCGGDQSPWRCVTRR